VSTIKSQKAKSRWAVMVNQLYMLPSLYLAVVTDPAFNIKLANFHLLSNSSISNSSIKWKPAHIKGHQDDIQPKEDLSRIAQLNVEMDLLARKHL
jgi:hypothetical protein